MNLIEGRVEPGCVMVGSTLIPLPPDLVRLVSTGQAVTVGLRPESLELGGAGDGAIPAVVTLVEELGAEAFVYAQVADGRGRSVTALNDLIARVTPRDAPEKGERVNLRPTDGAVLLFDIHSGVRVCESA